MDAKCCNEHVCLLAYLYSTRPNVTKFSVHVNCGHGSVLPWWQYNK